MRKLPLHRMDAGMGSHERLNAIEAAGEGGFKQPEEALRSVAGVYTIARRVALDAAFLAESVWIVFICRACWRMAQNTDNPDLA